MCSHHKGLILKLVLTVFNLALFGLAVALIVSGLALGHARNILVGVMAKEFVTKASLYVVVEDEFVETCIRVLAEFDDSYGIFVTLVGVLLLFFAIAGLIGTLSEKPNWLRLHAFAVAVLAVFLLFVSLQLTVFSAEVRLRLGLRTKEILEEHYNMESKKLVVGFTLLWDNIQAALECCGVTNYTNFAETINFDQDKAIVPQSCCQQNQKCAKDPDEDNSFIKYSCMDAMWDEFGPYYQKTINALFWCIICVGVIFCLDLWLANICDDKPKQTKEEYEDEEETKTETKKEKG